MRDSAALRAAVPAPTGRTGQRSAFPGLRAVRVSGYSRPTKPLTDAMSLSES